MYKLVIQDDEGKTTVVPLIRDELTIGRKDGNTIRLTERNVSRRHAKVLRLNGSITIEDLNSYNGIRVNGSRIQGKVEIKETDRVQIGDYLIEVKTDAPRSEAKTQPVDRMAVPQADTVRAASEAATLPMVNPAAEAEASPTERISPVGAVDPGVDAAPQQQPQAESQAECGRLVALSTNFAGREFVLDKPAMIIGRTDENDVWLNHRSISRHHAKIVRENGRYAIVDLQSSNGVRVNGEEYGKVELRRGDLVDLGHVRLRFVEAGEDFVFGRDAHPVDLSVEGQSRTGLWLVLLLLLLGGGVGAMIFLGGDSDDQAQADVATLPGTDDEDASETAGAEEPDLDPVVEPGTPIDAAPAETDVRELLDTAIAARQGDDWEAMESAASQALALDSGNEEAAALLEQARSEIANQEIFRELEEAVAGRKFVRVAELYAQLDNASVYKVKAQPDHDRLKAEYIKYQSQVAKKAADSGQCRTQKRLARDVIAQWPEASEAVLSHDCRTQTTSGGGSSGDTGTGGTTTTGGGTGPDSGDGDGPAPDDGGSEAPDSSPGYDVLIERAKEAAKNSHFGKAEKLCRQALAKKPGDQEATMVCAIATCNLKKASSAQRFVGRIQSSSYKSMARQICLRNGVDIP